jgi:hypothetical protein
MFYNISNKKIVLLLIGSLFSLTVSAHNFLTGKSLQPKQKQEIRFTENKNQWHADVKFKLEMHGGAIFFENQALTYSLLSADDLEKLEQVKHGNTAGLRMPAEWIIRAHAYRVNFVDALRSVKINGNNPFADYKNYFLGNDPSRWATNVISYKNLQYQNIYRGVDLIFYGSGDKLKYDFIVKPGASTQIIQLDYQGLRNIAVSNGNLILSTSVNTVIEQKPYAYQMINGKEKPVACNYKLRNNRITFDFPDGYNKDYELVIDPVLTFSTYTGSTADNFGFTATYDNAGNLYAGGIVFNIGYPATLGAFQVNYSGQVDVGITKFTPDGTSLIYSTYLGGVDTESPSSLVVNSANELIVLGTTGSSDFPTSVTGYDRTFNGGLAVNFPNNGTTFNNGTDIFISKFNAAGTALTGSTFLGGTNNDGINFNSINILQYNYGDQFRGEVIVDASDNIYIASSTLSNNFPTTAGSFQTIYGGAQDAVICKFNTDLSSLLWSSYFGGGFADAGYSLKLDGSNNLFVCGGTISNNLPNTAGGLLTAIQGGTDGYVAKINNSGTALLQTTYIGTNLYDQTYFVDLDRFDNVYVFGQTGGAYPVSGGVYFNASGKQFIHKLNNNLNTTLFSTTFGSGSANVNISPTAFLVDVCGFIYASGWGGTVNTSWNSNTGTTSGMPVTSNAFQSTTDGSDFYFIVLSPDAAGLEYATFFGGNGSYEHVDGGTSRFDKRGAIYQAVCAGCGGNSLFPTTPGVWSNTNNSFNCNLGALKFDFQISAVTVDVEASPSIQGCAPLTVHFNDIGVNAQNYFWNFDDGNTSYLKNPVHTFSSNGSYNVMLVGYDSTSCAGVRLADTSFVTIAVFGTTTTTIDTSICAGQSLFAGGTFQTSSGTYYDTLLTASGCDSTVITNLTIVNSITTFLNAEVCLGAPYNGVVYFSDTILTDTLIAAGGCDSIVTTSVIILPLFNTSEDVEVCIDSAYNGIVYTSDTSLVYNLTAQNGCDSTHTVNITLISCCPPPAILCNSVVVPYNQTYCGAFILPSPDVTSQCNIVSLTNDYAGGPFPEGITIVTWVAIDQYGQTDTCRQAVIYNPVSLLSSYTILGFEHVDLMPTNDVRTGAVGVMNTAGEAYLQNHTLVTGSGSFVAAPVITTFPNTQVTNPVYTAANPTLPPFEINPSPSGQDITVSTNSSIVLTDTVYGRIRLFRGATVTFNNPFGVVNVKEIRVNNKAAGSHTTLKFNQCTKVRVKERVDLGPKCTINPDSLKVIFYVEGANTTGKDNQPTADIGPDARVYADFYVPNGRFYAHPGSNVKPAQYIGTYIAKWITGDPDIIWRRRADCDSNYNCVIPVQRLAGIDNINDETILFETNPNPMRDLTAIRFRLNESSENVSVQIYNTTGQVVSNLFNGKTEANKIVEIHFDASDLSSGIYYTLLQTDKGYYSRKIVVLK